MNQLSQKMGKVSIALLTGLLCSLLGSNSLQAATVVKKEAVLGKNLIVNGNGEQGTCDPIGNAVGSAIPSIPAWQTTGSLSVLCYGATGFEFVNNFGETVSVRGLPDANSPGPENRGNNLFFGGADRASSSASQLIDVAPLASVIDAGKAVFDLSGWLGGYSADLDNVQLSLNFLDENSQSLGIQSIASPTPEERNNTTALLFRSLQGFLPTGSRQIDVTLNMNHVRGRVNDAYADQLSLVITQVPEPSMSGLWVVGITLVIAGKLRKHGEL
ncbi:MAG: hypothetical protein RLZZ507_1915 [Cyanobacteriota bacterium]|jgi:hypothetical protein